MKFEDIPILDSVFKDDTPQNTVARIKDILKANNIETTEKWNDSGVPNCYSVRVTVSGTVFGSNGKGVTEEFALASGYGELMERLQLGVIFKEDQQKSGDSYLREEEQYKTVEELLSRNKKWYSHYADKVYQMTGETYTEEELLKQYADEEGKIPVREYYCVTTDSWEYLPSEMLLAVYTANGTAAGNTPEEALVQSISEIVERQYSIHILSKGIVVPTVPEEVLRTYPTSYAIISYLEENGFKVMVKDCSLGAKFPVVCVCLINQKTGKYHTHFGAAPHFEIALQRTLTESFQGRNIDKVAEFDRFIRRSENKFDVAHLANQLIKGAAEKTPEFFLESAEPYEKPAGFTGVGNRELFKECVEFLHDMGYDVLIRDYSCLGFPTYQVIVPGYSETGAHRIAQRHDDTLFRNIGRIVSRNPSAASLEDRMGFMMHWAQLAKRRVAPSSFSLQVGLPLRISIEEEHYLRYATIASVNYSLGRYTSALEYIDKMLTVGIQKDRELLLGIRRYLTLSEDEYTEKEILSILTCFHRPETVSYITQSLRENRNLLDRFTLNCDLQCQPTCHMYEHCVKKHTDVIARLIQEKQKGMDRTRLPKQMHELLQ